MKREKVKELGHLIAGLFVMYHGFDKLDKGDFKVAAIYLGLAILFMIVAGLRKMMMNKFQQGDTAFYLLEAITIFYSGWYYKENGDTALFYIMAIAAAFFFIGACSSLQFDEKPRRNRRRKKRHKRTSVSNADSVTGQRSEV